MQRAQRHTAGGADKVAPRLLLFNPDTDYALASPRLNYTPPAHVVSLRRQLALLPAIYANPGDTILLIDEPDMPFEQLEYYPLAREKGVGIITLRQAAARCEQFADHVPDPWGWNMSLRHVLRKKFGDMPGLPSEESLRMHKALSHRRTTIPMLKEMSELLSSEIILPREITDTEQAVEAFLKDRELYFKSPWSSSGRGIMLTDDLEEKHVRPWVRGIIKSQGSVMMEKAYRRKLDFATEWMCRVNEAHFLGYSVFQTSRRGKYHGNIEGSQAELSAMIKRNAPEWRQEWLNAQKRALEKLIAPYYTGPLGIDMLVTESGNINPCVEINLRRTMGMLHLYK